jgi:hypothetical protein
MGEAPNQQEFWDICKISLYVSIPQKMQTNLASPRPFQGLINQTMRDRRLPVISSVAVVRPSNFASIHRNLDRRSEQNCFLALFSVLMLMFLVVGTVPPAKNCIIQCIRNIIRTTHLEYHIKSKNNN